MKEKIQGILEKVKEKCKKLSKKVVLLALGVLVLLAVVIALVLNHKPYAVLVTDVSQDEAGAIVQLLDNLGVLDYKVQGNDTILVPEKQESALKAKLLMEGYPKTGHSYEAYYEHVGALSTEAERKQAYMLSLAQSLAGTIRCLEGVKDASVEITPGEDRGYVLDSGNVVKASASVMVTMKDSAKLSRKMAEAIRHFVATGVQGLEIEKVTIIDNLGNTYRAGDEDNNGEASALKLQLEEEWENKIRTEVMKVLTPFFGPDNVKVGVNCEVELSRVTEQRTDVYLPEWANDGSTGGKGIIGAQKYDYIVHRPEDDTVGGLVGSETNSDIAEHVEEAADPKGNELELGGSGQVDYDNSRSEKEIHSTAGVLKDCSISVSLNSSVVKNVNYEDLRRHVARAAGIEGTIDPESGEEQLEDKISVISLAFYQPPVVIPPKFQIPLWVILAGGGGLLLFLILLIAILKIRKKRKKKKQQALEREQLLAAGGMQAANAAAAATAAAEAVAQTGADIMSLKSEKSMELRQDIRQFANDNPEIAAQQLKSWLRGGEEDG